MQCLFSCGLVILRFSYTYLKRRICYMISPSALQCLTPVCLFKCGQVTGCQCVHPKHPPTQPATALAGVDPVRKVLNGFWWLTEERDSLFHPGIMAEGTCYLDRRSRVCAEQSWSHRNNQGYGEDFWWRFCCIIVSKATHTLGRGRDWSQPAELALG